MATLKEKVPGSFLTEIYYGNTKITVPKRREGKGSHRGCRVPSRESFLKKKMKRKRRSNE